MSPTPIVGTLALLVALTSGCGGTTETAARDRPEPSVPGAASNPLDTDDNRLACTSSRRAVGDKQSVFTDFGKGTALPAEVAEAAKELQGDAADAGSYSGGSIQTNLIALSDSYGRMRVALTTNDLPGLSAAVAEQNTALAALDKDCTSIGE